MNTVTKRDLLGAFNRYVEAVRSLGLLADDEGLGLTTGSKTNGIAFRIHTMKSGSTGYFSPPAGDDFLGFTKREAYNRLADRARVLEDVARNLPKGNS